MLLDKNNSSTGQFLSPQAGNYLRLVLEFILNIRKTKKIHCQNVACFDNRKGVFSS